MDIRDLPYVGDSVVSKGESSVKTDLNMLVWDVCNSVQDLI